jgi:membrane associated rhomboid family serine protease
MHNRTTQIRIGGPLTPVVKQLLIANGFFFLVQTLFGFSSSRGPGGYNVLVSLFGLHHQGLVYEFKIWQLFTYMFLHGGLMHLLSNMLGLWMFGGELEEKWGSRFFARYYFYSGIGAGICIAVLNAVTGTTAPTIGASGAIFAILLAYGLYWPDREVLIMFVIPVKIKYLLIFFGFISFYGVLVDAMGRGGAISHAGHLGGLAAGFLILRFFDRGKTSGGGGKDRVPEKPGVISEFFRKRRIEKKRSAIDTRIQAKKIIDQLLEKIARTGMGSLTSEEKKRLEWARKHYYPDNKDMLH